MKATGKIRYVDDLGRVVIPKEVRTQLNIKEGTALEVYTDYVGNSPTVCFTKLSSSFTEEIDSLKDRAADVMETAGEFALSAKFKKAIEDAAKALQEFEDKL